MLLGSRIHGAEEETGGYAGAFLQGGIGARAIALGNTFSAIADDGSALFWNPAGLPLINRYELSIMHSMMFEDRAKNYASVNLPMDGLAVSAGWLGFNVSDIQERNNQGQLIGHFSDSENLFLLGAGVTIISNRLMRFNLGFTGKYFYHSLYNFQATGFGGDVGGLFRMKVPGLIKAIGVGVVAQNIGSNMQWDTESNYEAVIPMTIRAGAMVDMALLPFRVTVDMEKHEKQDMRLHYGAEYGILNTIFLRAGMNDTKLSAGAGLKLGFASTRFLVDYAFTTDDISEQPMHYFTLGLGF